MNTRTLRPSGWKVWSVCAQAPQRARHAQPKPDTEDSIRGTACHEGAERCLVSYLPGSQGVVLTSDLVGWTAGNGYTLTADDAEAVEVYTRFCLNLVNSVGGLQSMRVEQNAPAAQVHRDLWGTMDFGLYAAATRTVHVVDYKNGVVPVEAFGNGQTVIYACHLVIANPDAEHVELTIVQPNRYDDADPISTWRLTVAEFWQWIGWLAERASLTDDPNAPYVTGRHCVDCDGLLACPAMRKASEQAVKIAEWVPPVGELTPDQMGALLTMYTTAVSTLKTMLDVIEPQAMVTIDKGVYVPGWAMGHGRSSRVWKPTTNLKSIEMMLEGVSLHDENPVSPAEAEKRGVGKELVKVLADKIEGKRKLVPDNDNQRAKKVFSNV